MEVVRSHPHRERRVERVVFGGTLWSQNSLLLHNEQDLSIAIPYRPQQVPFPSPKACRPKQVHSTFRGASTSLWFFLGVDHLFQPFFIIVGWLDCLFCRFPGPKPVVPSLAQDSIAFHCHRVPDSFQLPHCDGFVEVRDPLDLVRAPLVCSISGVFSSGRREGLGRFSWALQDPARNHPPGIVHTCLFFPTFVGSGLSWLYFGWRMEAIGRRWYCDSFNVGRPGSDASRWVCRMIEV